MCFCFLVQGVARLRLCRCVLLRALVPSVKCAATCRASPSMSSLKWTGNTTHARPGWPPCVHQWQAALQGVTSDTRCSVFPTRAPLLAPTRQLQGPGKMQPGRTPHARTGEPVHAGQARMLRSVILERTGASRGQGVVIACSSWPSPSHTPTALSTLTVAPDASFCRPRFSSMMTRRAVARTSCKQTAVCLEEDGVGASISEGCCESYRVCPRKT